MESFRQARERRTLHFGLPIVAAASSPPTEERKVTSPASACSSGPARRPPTSINKLLQNVSDLRYSDFLRIFPPLHPLHSPLDTHSSHTLHTFPASA